MSPQSSGNRWSVLKIALAVIGLLLTALGFSLGSGFIYNRLYNVPDLSYEVLSTYELEGVSFAGLTLENRGRATAHKVLVNLGDLQTNIKQYDIQCPELFKIEAGGTDTDTLVMSLERMAKGSSLTVYLLTDGEAQLDRLAVMADEGPGHLAAEGSMAQLSLFGALLAFVALAAIATLANIGVTSIRTIRARSHVSATLLEYEQALLTRDIELQRLRGQRDALQAQVDDWLSGKRTPPARKRTH